MTRNIVLSAFEGEGFDIVLVNPIAKAEPSAETRRGPKLVYDPERATVSYGFYVCPECEASFYGGGKALHKAGCSNNDYASCEYHFGDAQVKDVIKKGEKYGPDFSSYGITLNDLREQFPELLERKGE